MREIKEGEFSKNKARDWNNRKHLETWREAWSKDANKALERAGHQARIDHRTLKEQGIDREPKNKSQAVYEMEKRGVVPEKSKPLANSWYELRHELDYIDQQIKELEKQQGRKFSPAVQAVIDEREARDRREREQGKGR